MPEFVGEGAEQARLRGLLKIRPVDLDGSEMGFPGIPGRKDTRTGPAGDIRGKVVFLDVDLQSGADLSPSPTRTSTSGLVPLISQPLNSPAAWCRVDQVSMILWLQALPARSSMARNRGSSCISGPARERSKSIDKVSAGPPVQRP